MRTYSYDVSPGADDNASGIAGLLELARLLRNHSFDKTLRFVAFALEEPPFFRSRFMGSYVYAKSLSEKKATIDGIICLEMIGYFSDKIGSQYFPSPFLRWFYPDKGNFITLFSIIPGIDFSDHWSFYEFGYPALMVTDTGFYRNPNYHEISDTSETLDYERMVKVVLGLRAAIEELAGGIV